MIKSLGWTRRLSREDPWHHKLLLLPRHLSTVHLWHAWLHILHKLLLLLLRPVSILRRGCHTGAIHVHYLLNLYHLLNLHYLLQLMEYCDAHIGRLRKLCQLGHFATVCKLLDILLRGQFWRLFPPLIFLKQILELQANEKKGQNSTHAHSK